LFEGRLARFKHPRKVIITDALPKNALGKVARYKLRETPAGREPAGVTGVVRGSADRPRGR